MSRNLERPNFNNESGSLKNVLENPGEAQNYSVLVWDNSNPVWADIGLTKARQSAYCPLITPPAYTEEDFDPVPYQTIGPFVSLKPACCYPGNSGTDYFNPAVGNPDSLFRTEIEASGSGYRAILYICGTRLLQVSAPAHTKFINPVPGLTYAQIFQFTRNDFTQAGTYANLVSANQYLKADGSDTLFCVSPVQGTYNSKIVIATTEVLTDNVETHTSGASRASSIACKWASDFNAGKITASLLCYVDKYVIE